MLLDGICRDEERNNVANLLQRRSVHDIQVCFLWEHVTNEHHYSKQCYGYRELCVLQLYQTYRSDDRKRSDEHQRAHFLRLQVSYKHDDWEWGDEYRKLCVLWLQFSYEHHHPEQCYGYR